MEISTFFQNEDMSFGFDGKKIGFDNQYFNAAGGESRAQQVANWYPLSNNCTELDNTIARAKDEINANKTFISNTKNKVAQKRVKRDYNDIIGRRINELESKKRELNCDAKKDAEETTQFLTELKNKVGSDSSTSGSGNSTTGGGIMGNSVKGASGLSKPMKYGLIGLGALAFVGSILVMIKKKKG